MKYFKWIISGEFLFALFLSAGTFKTVIPIHFIDITLLLLLITVLIAIKRIITKNFKFYKVSIVPIFVFVFLVMIAVCSMYYSPSGLYAIDKILRLSVITSWCFIGPFFLFKNNDSIKKFLLALILLALVMAFDIITGPTTSGDFKGSLGSSYLVLAQINTMGLLILLGIFIFSKKEKVIKILLITLMVIVTIPIIQSGARGPVLILFVIMTILFFSMFKFRKQEVLISKKIVPMVLILTIFLFSVLYLIQQGYAETLLYRLEVIVNQDGGGESVNGRTDRISVAITMAKESFLLGKGIGSFPIYYNGLDIDDYPHNTYLEFLSELGMIGLILFIIINIISVRNGYKDYKKNGLNNINAPIFLVSIFWFFNSNISGSINGDKFFFAFLAILILLPVLSSIKRPKTESILKDENIINS
ncbi:O-antigen ligase family protein [Domibacillus epiphyticus]|uniref:O-antigen ligase-related domain-containing protein n=1 Tax=Domibacillus epiphyticus TaxID=1714355 RepID=A0A1V2A6K0_9BACI|nr:O-antigen ligase family protein [Domibacillus epiphyticus]OMP66631.1 hypothetical protein BTO28_11350 [Domibacillus epiphyticus]